MYRTKEKTRTRAEKQNFNTEKTINNNRVAYKTHSTIRSRDRSANASNVRGEQHTHTHVTVQWWRKFYGDESNALQIGRKRNARRGEKQKRARRGANAKTAPGLTVKFSSTWSGNCLCLRRWSLPIRITSTRSGIFSVCNMIAFFFFLRRLPSTNDRTPSSSGYHWPHT